MILEIADFRIQPGRQAEFDTAIEHGVRTWIATADGYRSHRVVKGIERYVLMIWWDTLEAHTVGFRGGDRFPKWRAIVGPFFAAPPLVQHFDVVGTEQPAAG
jgi:heme-degrading monooxygenase HmoA